MIMLVTLPEDLTMESLSRKRLPRAGQEAGRKHQYYAAGNIRRDPQSVMKDNATMRAIYHHINADDISRNPDV